jgi:threonine synthase
MLIDPHTAVGVAAAREHARSGLATVTLATAHPAKFPDAVIRATGVRPTLPAHLAELMDLPETTTVLPGELSTIENFVRSVARTS